MTKVGSCRTASTFNDNHLSAKLISVFFWLTARLTEETTFPVAQQAIPRHKMQTV
jgi:hypothetical protein